MWTFTNTITTLPFGYWLKITLYTSSGTGTLTATNGGYIAGMTPCKSAYQLGSSSYKPGSVTVQFINRDNAFSTNVFTHAMVTTGNAMELHIEVSFNAGTTWANVFVGVGDTNAVKYDDTDATETRGRVYEVEFTDPLLTLKDIDSALLGVLLTPADVIMPNTAILKTDTSGSPINYDDGYPLMTTMWTRFTSVIEAVLGAGFAANFVSGASVAVDYAGLAAYALRDRSANVIPFSDWVMFMGADEAAYQAQKNWYAPGFLRDSGGANSAYDARNFAEVLKRVCDSLAVVPVTSYAAGVYTVGFRPRITGTGTSHALAGILLSRSWSLADTYDAVKVTTVGLPRENAGSSSIMGGSNHIKEIKNLFVTQPVQGITSPYLFVEAYMQTERSGLIETKIASSVAVGAYVSPTAVEPVGQVTYDGTNWYESTGPQYGWYGFQQAAYAAFAATFDKASGFKPTFEIGLHGIAANPIGLLDSVVVGSVDYIVIEREVDYLRNNIRLKVQLQ